MFLVIFGCSTLLNTLCDFDKGIVMSNMVK